MKIKYTAIATGNGSLKSGEITEFTKSIPDEASVNIETKKAVDQRDNDRWTLSADWEGDSGKPHKPTITYPPGVRGVNATGRPIETL